MRPLSTDRLIFVDTSAYYAAGSPRDGSHAQASATMGRLVVARHSFVTTNLVLAELHGLALARHARERAIEMLATIKASATTTIVRVRPVDEDRAWAILLQYDDKAFSLTDATSFAVMERLGIRTAFALDRHFAQFGWETVPLEGARADSQ